MSLYNIDLHRHLNSKETNVFCYHVAICRPKNDKDTCKSTQIDLHTSSFFSLVNISLVFVHRVHSDSMRDFEMFYY